MFRMPHSIPKALQGSLSNMDFLDVSKPLMIGLKGFLSSNDVPVGCRFQWANRPAHPLCSTLLCAIRGTRILLEDALKPDASVALAKQASSQYAYLLRTLWPRWTHRPADAQRDALTTERCAQGKYCLSRAVEFDKLLVLAQKNYSMNLQRQLQTNAAHMYGNCAAYSWKHGNTGMPCFEICGSPGNVGGTLGADRQRQRS